MSIKNFAERLLRRSAKPTITESGVSDYPNSVCQIYKNPVTPSRFNGKNTNSKSHHETFLQFSQIFGHPNPILNRVDFVNRHPGGRHTLKCFRKGGGQKFTTFALIVPKRLTSTRRVNR